MGDFLSILVNVIIALGFISEILSYKEKKKKSEFEKNKETFEKRRKGLEKSDKKNSSSQKAFGGLVDFLEALDGEEEKLIAKKSKDALKKKLKEKEELRKNRKESKRILESQEKNNLKKKEAKISEVSLNPNSMEQKKDTIDYKKLANDYHNVEIDIAKNLEIHDLTESIQEVFIIDEDRKLEEFRKAIIMKEILDRPLALREY